MGAEVTLTADQRRNLLTMQNTQRQAGVTQSRLATGKKVSSATDDAAAYFTARSLQERSRDYLEVKDKIDMGVSTIKATLDGLSAVEKLLTQMKSLALAAQQSDKASDRSALQTQ